MLPKLLAPGSTDANVLSHVSGFLPPTYLGAPSTPSPFTRRGRIFLILRSLDKLLLSPLPKLEGIPDSLGRLTLF